MVFELNNNQINLKIEIFLPPWCSGGVKITRVNNKIQSTYSHIEFKVPYNIDIYL